MPWRMRRLALFLVLVSCQYRLPVEPLRLELASLRLGETDFAELLHAVERVQLKGKATLRPGRFALPLDDYEAMEIVPDTTVRFAADVSLASVEATDGDRRLEVTPAVRTFRVRFDHPIVLLGRGNRRRITLDGAALTAERGAEVDVGVRFGRTLVGTIATAVVGVPGGAAPTEVTAALSRVELPEVEVRLRRSAVLHHGASVLYLREAARLRLSRVDIDVAAGAARLDVSGRLALGTGSCLVGDAGQLCTEAMTLALQGAYERVPAGAGDPGTRPIERLRLAQLESPTRLEVGVGTVSGRGGAELLAIEGAQVELRRYECAGPVGGDSRCVYEVAAELQGGAGEAAVEGVPLRFESLAVRGVRLRRGAGDEGDVQATEIALGSPRLRTPMGEAHFAALALRDLQGARFDELGLASASVVAKEGAAELRFGELALAVELAGETRLRLSQRERLRLEVGPGTSRPGEASGGEGSAEDSASGGELVLRAEVDALELRRNAEEAPILRAEGIVVDATLGAAGAQAELRVRRDVEVNADALSDVAIAGLRLRFEAIRLTHGAEGTKLSTQGLQLALPQREVLALLQPQIPPTFVGEESRVDPHLEAALQVATPLSDYTRFRSRLEVAGLDGLGFGFERERLRIQGEVAATMKLLADEHRVHLRECHHRVASTLRLPCFEGGAPALCEREVAVEIPYPCVEDEDVDAEVLAGSLHLDIDVSGVIESNAPAQLDELALTARVSRCDRIEIRGMAPSLQRALDVRGIVCDELLSLSRTVAFAELLDLRASPLAGAHVRQLALDSGEEDVIVALDVDVPLQPGRGRESVGAVASD